MRSLILLLLVAAASAKVFQRCEWARTLKAGGMDGYQNVSLADCEYQPVCGQMRFSCIQQNTVQTLKDEAHTQHL